VAQLSLEEKVDLATGVGWENGYCVGNTPAIENITFPGLCLQDSPLGVRYTDFNSAFPAGINAATTFNRDLIRKRGVAMGQEFRGKGVNVQLGPMMNLMRAPAAGRNWEGFGGDPFLSGEAAHETILGIQSTGVQACAKHLINNEQEHFRTASSSNVDDRCEHELYYHPFLRSIQANVAAIMCSYSETVNNTWACQNEKTLNDVIKGEFGFPGCTYWSATHSTISVNYGLDMTMPGDITLGSGTTYFGEVLVEYVKNGSVSEARVTDMAQRILAGWYLLGQDQDYPTPNFDSWNLSNPFNKHVNVEDDHKTLIREIGVASTVLLKNDKGVLPLGKPDSLAIIGSGARNSTVGPNGYTDRGGDNGVLAMGWGSGTANFPYLVAPYDSISARAKQDGTVVSAYLNDTDLDLAVEAATGADYAFVFITSDSGEGYITVDGNEGDRNNLSAWYGGDRLVNAVASVNNNTVVIINSVGAIRMEAWVEHDNGMIWSGLPGQEAGNAVTDVLYGDYNPSGRLPYTVGKSIDDYGAEVIYVSDVDILQINYTDGIFVDYRYFDKYNITPRFPFGHGLSYTTFEYSDLSISGSTAGGGYNSTENGASLDPWLHEKVVTVTFFITNTGDVAGNEIPQLYLTLPSWTDSAPLNLKGFDSIYLQPGQSSAVTIQLSRYDFSIWDVTAQKWVVPEGSTTISIGASSRDIRLTGDLWNS
ncbi:glycoside hydrolase family 3 protein, partial [Fistulina hepatica ATCC 64428]